MGEHRNRPTLLQSLVQSHTSPIIKWHSHIRLTTHLAKAGLPILLFYPCQLCEVKCTDSYSRQSVCLHWWPLCFLSNCLCLLPARKQLHPHKQPNQLHIRPDHHLLSSYLANVSLGNSEIVAQIRSVQSSWAGWQLPSHQSLYLFWGFFIQS